MTGTLTETDKLYDAVQELVDAIYGYEGSDVLPPGTEFEARGIAANLIRACAEGPAVADAIQNFWKERENVEGAFHPVQLDM